MPSWLLPPVPSPLLLFWPHSLHFLILIICHIVSITYCPFYGFLFTFSFFSVSFLCLNPTKLDVELAPKLCGHCSRHGDGASHELTF